jgi:hypothetical protein
MELQPCDETTDDSPPPLNAAGRRLLEALRSCHAFESDRVGKCFACTVLAEHLTLAEGVRSDG